MVQVLSSDNCILPMCQCANAPAEIAKKEMCCRLVQPSVTPNPHSTLPFPIKLLPHPHSKRTSPSPTDVACIEQYPAQSSCSELAVMFLCHLALCRGLFIRTQDLVLESSCRHAHTWPIQSVCSVPCIMPYTTPVLCPYALCHLLYHAVCYSTCTRCPGRHLCFVLPPAECPVAGAQHGAAAVPCALQELHDDSGSA